MSRLLSEYSWSVIVWRTALYVDPGHALIWNRSFSTFPVAKVLLCVIVAPGSIGKFGGLRAKKPGSLLIRNCQ